MDTRELYTAVFLVFIGFAVVVVLLAAPADRATESPGQGLPGCTANPDAYQLASDYLEEEYGPGYSVNRSSRGLMSCSGGELASVKFNVERDGENIGYIIVRENVTRAEIQ
ncbi:MAG: hypothetical protein ABEJ69_01880 [Candidatus Nanohaloarchaea archaeon]